MEDQIEETTQLNAERYVVNKYGFNCANPNYKKLIDAEQKAFIAGAKWQDEKESTNEDH